MADGNLKPLPAFPVSSFQSCLRRAPPVRAQAGARNEGTQSPVWSASASFDGGSGAGSGSDTEPEEAAPVRRTHSSYRAPADPELAAADADVDPAEYDAPFLDPQTTDAEIADTLKCGADNNAPQNSSAVSLRTSAHRTYVVVFGRSAVRGAGDGQAAAGGGRDVGRLLRRSRPGPLVSLFASFVAISVCDEARTPEALFLHAHGRA